MNIQKKTTEISLFDKSIVYKKTTLKMTKTMVYKTLSL